MSTLRSGSARREILDSVRNHLEASAAFDSAHKIHHASPDNDGAVQPIQGGGVIEMFCERVRLVNGNVVAISGSEELTDALQKVIDELEPRTIAISDSELVRSVVIEIRTDAEIIENASTAELFNCDVGITTAQLAIAETGTLVLESKKEFSRLTSLVPETHICLLEANKIRRTMSEILDLMAKDLSPAVTFITGPSRTSDIELTLAIGVHGPRHLYVFVIQN